MKERPILFSAPMVRSLLDGSKTQTRRILKKQPPFLARLRHAWFNAPIYGFTDEDAPAANWWKIKCPYGQPGDRLWVRETWAVGKCADGLAPAMLHPGTWLKDNGGLWLPADGTEPEHPISPRGKTRVSIHMPRWASRITLEVTGIRVERLQDISEEDAIAEGMELLPCHRNCGSCIEVNECDGADPTGAYERLWESLNGAGSWEANPWVWVIEFKRVQP